MKNRKETKWYLLCSMAGKQARQLLFPLRCPVCDRIVQPYGEKICVECVPKFKLITPPWCMCCGKKLLEEGEYCGSCKGKKRSYIRGRALYEYESAAASLYRFKYGKRQEYADFYGEEMWKWLGGFIRGAAPDALVPIPLHKKRIRKRGYNQAALLARALGRCAGLPVYENLLKRVKNTAPLKSQNPKERQNNLKKAFHICQNDVKLSTIIIIDDIYTTGSTVEEAARALKEHGVEKVYFLTLAGGAGI